MLEEMRLRSEIRQANQEKSGFEVKDEDDESDE